MKTIFKVSWQIWVKNGYDAENSLFQHEESYFETKAGAEEFSRKLQDANKILGFKQKLSTAVIEVRLNESF